MNNKDKILTNRCCTLKRRRENIKKKLSKKQKSDNKLLRNMKRKFINSLLNTKVTSRLLELKTQTKLIQFIWNTDKN